MSKHSIRRLIIVFLITFTFSLLLTACSENFEPEQLAEDTAVILNDWWDYASRFFTTLWENLTCVSSFAGIFGFLGFLWHKVK